MALLIMVYYEHLPASYSSSVAEIVWIAVYCREVHVTQQSKTMESASSDKILDEAVFLAFEKSINPSVIFQLLVNSKTNKLFLLWLSNRSSRKKSRIKTSLTPLKN